jgi:hypothetical protein
MGFIVLVMTVTPDYWGGVPAIRACLTLIMGLGTAQTALKEGEPDRVSALDFRPQPNQEEG